MTTTAPTPPFDPRDFLGFAEQLARKDEATQAEPRSAVSRAYYAVHLRARERLIVQGDIQRTATRDVHWTVIQMLRASGGSIGRRLDQLRIRRNTADYDLNTMISREAVLLAVNTAKDLYPRL